MTAATHAPRSRLADIGGLPAGRTAPRSTRHHGLAVSCARDLTNMGGKSLPHVGSARQTTGNSGRARLQAADFPTLAMLKPPEAGPGSTATLPAVSSFQPYRTLAGRLPSTDR